MNDKLIEAAKSGDLKKIEELLKSGANLHYRDHIYEATPLLWAACNGHTKLVKYLLSRGANIKDKNKTNNSSLMLSVHYGHLETLQFLVEETQSRLSDVDDAGRKALHIAAMNGHKHIVEYLLTRPDCTVHDQDENENTALRWAATNNKTDVCRFLLERGSEILFISNLDHDTTQLLVATQQLLINARAGIINIEQLKTTKPALNATLAGVTALHYLLGSKAFNSAAALIHAGARMDINSPLKHYNADHCFDETTCELIKRNSNEHPFLKAAVLFVALKEQFKYYSNYCAFLMGKRSTNPTQDCFSCKEVINLKTKLSELFQEITIDVEFALNVAELFLSTAFDSDMSDMPLFEQPWFDPLFAFQLLISIPKKFKEPFQKAQALIAWLICGNFIEVKQEGRGQIPSRLAKSNIEDKTRSEVSELTLQTLVRSGIFTSSLEQTEMPLVNLCLEYVFPKCRGIWTLGSCHHSDPQLLKILKQFKFLLDRSKLEYHLEDLKKRFIRQAKQESQRNKKPQSLALQLFEAILAGDTQTAIECINQGANILFKDPTGKTALVLAVTIGFADVVNFILSKNKNAIKETYQDRTLLMLAAELGHLTLVKILIQKWKMDPNKTGVNNKANTLHLAIRGGHLPIVQYLIKIGCKMHILHDETTPLSLAACHGHLDIIKFFIANKHSEIAELSKVDIPGWNACIGAAYYGHFPLIQYFVKKMGVSPQIRSRRGNSLVLSAAIGNQIPTLNAIIDAEFNLITDKDNTGRTVFLHAAERNHPEMMKHLLINHGSSLLETDNWNRSALVLAANNHQCEATLFLLEEGAYINDHFSVWAYDIGNIDFTPRRYLERDTEFNKSYKKTLPIIIAAETLINDAKEGKVDVSVLNTLGKSLNGRNASDGFTALHYALDNFHLNAVITLLEAEARVDIPSLTQGTAIDLEASNPIHHPYAKGLFEIAKLESTQQVCFIDSNTTKRNDTIAQILEKAVRTIHDILNSFISFSEQEPTKHGYSPKWSQDQLDILRFRLARFLMRSPEFFDPVLIYENVMFISSNHPKLYQEAHRWITQLLHEGSLILSRLEGDSIEATRGHGVHKAVPTLLQQPIDKKSAIEKQELQKHLHESFQIEQLLKHYLLSDFKYAIPLWKLTTQYIFEQPLEMPEIECEIGNEIDEVTWAITQYFKLLQQTYSFVPNVVEVRPFLFQYPAKYAAENTKEIACASVNNTHSCEP